MYDKIFINRINEERISVKFNRDRNVVDAITSIDRAYWDGIKKIWSMRYKPETIEKLKKLFKDRIVFETNYYLSDLEPNVRITTVRKFTIETSPFLPLFFQEFRTDL